MTSAPQVDRWADLLHTCALKATPPRRAVLDALATLGSASCEEVHRLAAETVPGLSLSTAYRLLEVLAEHQVVAHHHRPPGTKHFRLASAPGPAHLVCRTCHGVWPVSGGLGAELAGALLAETGFTADLGHLTVLGRCVDCPK